MRRVFAERRNVLDDTELELKRTESDVAVVETRITRDSERLQASSSVKDVAALEQELAALKKRLSDLEEIELTVMERAEEQQAEVDATQAELDALQAKRLALEIERDAALEGIEKERSAAAAARSALEARIPEELLALYEKQKARYGNGASLLRGRRVERERRPAERDGPPDRARRRAGRRAAVPGFQRDPGPHERVRHLMARTLIVEADGGSRGNPGLSGFGRRGDRPALRGDPRRDRAVRRHRVQQRRGVQGHDRRRAPRARAGSGRRAAHPHGLEARRRADVRTLEDQAPGDGRPRRRRRASCSPAPRCGSSGCRGWRTRGRTSSRTSPWISRPTSAADADPPRRLSHWNGPARRSRRPPVRRWSPRNVRAPQSTVVGNTHSG